MPSSKLSKSLKMVLVAGARPNFMKVAPLIRAIHSHNQQTKTRDRISYYLVHTGQHYDKRMSEIFFNELKIPAPDINLDVGSGSHAEQTAKIMMAFEPVCLQKKPDWVVVFGDVNSTVACTLVASKLGIRVAHVEAGLRSFDRTMPEEINRVVTDSLADLLLTPSSDADLNLKREGIPAVKIRLVGNIMIDSLIANIGTAQKSRLPEQLGLKHKAFVYVTLHRPSNVDDPKSLGLIMGEVARLAHRYPVVFPVHPRTRKMLSRYLISKEQSPGLMFLEPVGYHDSLWLAKNSFFVLTDSGGLQEETTYFRTPCLTLRPNTERPITIRVGTNKITGLDTLREDIESIVKNRRPRGRIPKYWDGHAAERILAILLETRQSSLMITGLRT